MPDPRDVTGVILVGGKSTRMGRDKASLPLDGALLVDRVAAALRSVLPAIVLVGDRPGRFEGSGLPVYPDIFPGSSLGGLYTGLLRAGTPYVFAAACDLPFASPRILRRLLAAGEGFDAAVPMNGDRPEPLFALYHRNCLAPMKRMLEAGNRRIRDLYPEVRVRFLPEEETSGAEDGRAFMNVNTPEEYEAILEGKKGRR